MALSSGELQRSVTLFEYAPGKFVSHATLQRLLPDYKTALFFAKVFYLNWNRLSDLMRIVFPTKSIIEVLYGESSYHSHELQDFLVDIIPPYIQADHTLKIDETDDIPNTGMLQALFEAATTQVAAKIAEIAQKLGDVLDRMPSKYGEMTFQTLQQFNVQRNAIGTFSPVVQHKRQAKNLVIFDVSGSVSCGTVQALVDEVVGFSYDINASLAIVSTNAFWWSPGYFDTNTVLNSAEYASTQYHMLAPVLNEDWDTVVTIADYDSSRSSKNYLRDHCTGHIGEVLDISLVDKPTYLAECVGQFADAVTIMSISDSSYPPRD